MSFFTQRVIWKNAGSLSDLSVNLNDYLAGGETIAFNTATSDYLYIGSDLPFNHKYFEVQTANDQAASISIDIWYGGAWVPAVDIIDTTKVSGVSLAQSGLIQFRPEHDKGWDKEAYSEDVTGLENTDYYNMYWIRLSWSADLKATTALNYIGEKFSTDNEMYTEYAMLNNSAWKSKVKSGKTDWNDQHFSAAQYIIRDLKSRRVISSEHQILDSSLFTIPAIHKAASICFSLLQGEEMAKNAAIASNRYEKYIKMDNYFIDMDRDAEPSDYERSVQFGELIR
jgi:hypothetical protein